MSASEELRDKKRKISLPSVQGFCDHLNSAWNLWPNYGYTVCL